MWMRIVVLMAISAVWSSNAFAGESCPCANKEANIECLIANFNLLYRCDYARFGDIIWKQADIIKEKREEPEICTFLKLSIRTGTNAEFDEFFGSIVEPLLFEEPDLLLSSVMKMQLRYQNATMRFLQSPITAPKSEIDQVFIKMFKDGKYSSIVKLYFSMADNKSGDEAKNKP